MPFRHDRGEAAGVIEMMVRDHAVPDRLVRDDALRLGDDCLRARFVLRSRLENQRVIGELHRQRVVGAGDSKDAVGKLLRRRRRRGTGSRWCRRLLVRRRARQRRGTVKSFWRSAGFATRTQDVGFEDRPAAAPLNDSRREFQAVGIAIVKVLRFDEHVAEDRMLEPRLDALDEVLIVDEPDQAIRLAAG